MQTLPLSHRYKEVIFGRPSITYLSHYIIKVIKSSKYVTWIMKSLAKLGRGEIETKQFGKMTNDQFRKEQKLAQGQESHYLSASH